MRSYLQMTTILFQTSLSPITPLKAMHHGMVMLLNPGWIPAQPALCILSDLSGSLVCIFLIAKRDTTIKSF
ncbi:hypothetical protein PoB_004259300 [Plakobranchus ocellatus]|uniref:Uncharacterized protein n=1 Tax=Plakobranchus ocellatus TaxID=259542 RepID=A0AAV4B912_9GAST|nr:hypothetical protein PoB_004259300 [Plakobranchus ocellatus]